MITNNSTTIDKGNNPISPVIIEYKKITTFDLEIQVLASDRHKTVVQLNWFHLFDVLAFLKNSIYLKSRILVCFLSKIFLIVVDIYSCFVFVNILKWIFKCRWCKLYTGFDLKRSIYWFYLHLTYLL